MNVGQVDMICNSGHQCCEGVQHSRLLQLVPPHQNREELISFPILEGLDYSSQR